MVLIDEDIILENLSQAGEDHRGKYIDPEEYLSTVNASYKIINIMHLNIRSVRKNFDELLAFLVSYNISKCDVFILSECFQIETTTNFHIPGYTTLYNSGDYNRNDGIIIMIKSNLNYNLFNIKLVTCGVTLSVLELVVNGVSFKITSLYRPNPSNLISFIEEVDTHLSQNNRNYSFELFVGDINIDIMDESDANVHKYMSVLAKHGFEPYIRRPTRVTPETATCLDHIFLKTRLNTTHKYSINSFILNCNITDHYPVMMTISTKTKF